LVVGDGAFRFAVTLRFLGLVFSFLHDAVCGAA
jgi:hypothetical protein